MRAIFSGEFMKQTTIDRFDAWKKTAGKKDRFVSNRVVYTMEEFEKLLGRTTEVKHKTKTTKHINTDIEEKGYEDLESTQPSGHTEEFGDGDSQSTE